ncbi:hypothetical protein, partial [Leisingera sp.]|uniref:hypothetical protein n=1 Tax=Leisingera sp. TaxID=1879318 RepID=UPI002B266A09
MSHISDRSITLSSGSLQVHASAQHGSVFLLLTVAGQFLHATGRAAVFLQASPDIIIFHAILAIL